MTNDKPDNGATLDGQTAAEFIECANNQGEPIDWLFWAHKLPELTAAQAVRLMAGLNPDLFKSLEIERNESAGAAKMRAQRLEILAAGHHMERASPREWLAWADGLGEPVHVGYRLAVMKFTEPEATPAGEAVTIAGPGKMGNTTKGRRTHPLGAEIEAARREATSPDDYHSVYAELQRLAEQGKGPFIGFAEGEGCKYQTPAGTVAFFNRDALRKRMQRAANAR